MRRQILCFLLVTVLLTGCVTIPEQTVPTTAPAAVPTAAPTTEPTLPQIELQAVNQLSFQQASNAPVTCVVDQRTAAFLFDARENGQMKTLVRFWDLYTDQVCAEAILDGELKPLDGPCLDGYLALVDVQTKGVTVLDRMMTTVLEFQAPSAGGMLLPGFAYYYYIWGSQLRRLDTATEEDIQIVAEPALPMTQIVGYDVDRNVLLVKGAADVYSSDGCLYGVNLDSMDCVLLQPTTGDGMLAGDGICMAGEEVDEFRAGIVYADWDSEGIYTYPALMQNDKDYNTWHIDGTNYCFKVKYDPESNTKAAEMELYRLGETLEVCSLMEPMEKMRLKELFVLPDGNLLGMSVNRRGFQPYILCPDQLEFQKVSDPAETKTGLMDDSVIELHNQAQEDQKLPQQLQTVRTQADAVGEKYGVTVLLSNQCSSALTASGMEITTTDKAELENEAEVIAEALTTLDQALQLYPEGFFEQFRDEAGEHGLLILLVEEFSGDERGVIGLCYEMYPWYTIAVDITTWEVYNTYCHEIWHATENRINDLQPGLLLPEVWDPCNPEEFVYSYNTSASYVNDVEYTFFREKDSSRVFFVDAYAKTNCYEDRARLMEYIMCSEYAQDLVESPAILQKLTILCDAIRQAFDAEGWENVYWERFLP